MAPEDTATEERPVIRGRARRFFYEGARDVFDRTPGLKFLGAAIRKHVDQARKYDGELSAPYRKWDKKHSRKDRRRALKDFEAYWSANDGNPEKAADLLEDYPEASKELIELWRGSAKYANERNKGMTVWDDAIGAYRPIGSITDYFPRSVRPEVWELLEQGSKNQAEWDAMVKALIDEGMIKSEAEAKSYLERALKPVKRFDYLGNIEAARSLKLPNRAYDYSFGSARRYIKSWAERRAQVEAFGQKLGPKGKDLFDTAIEKVRDRDTKEYIQAVQKRAYNEVPDTKLACTAAFLNTLATPLHLANSKTVMRNLVSGLAYNQTTFGTRHALRAAVEMRKAWDTIEDAHEKGILSDDLMNMMHDAEQMQSKAINRLQRVSSGIFKGIGYRLSEDFVRAHSLLTANRSYAARSRRTGKTRGRGQP